MAGNAVYWDASAVISVLAEDTHSREAAKHLEASRAHLLSTLAYAEVLAVLGRLRRGRTVAAGPLDASLAALQNGPWHRITVVPTWDSTYRLAQKWPLRGADLWHLATADSLRRDFSRVRLITLDQNLREAAIGEGLL